MLYCHIKSVVRAGQVLAALGYFSAPALAQPKDPRVLGKEVIRANMLRDAADMERVSERASETRGDDSFWFYLGIIAVCGGAVEVVRQTRTQMSPPLRSDNGQDGADNHDHGDIATAADALKAFGWSTKGGSASLGIGLEPIVVDTRLGARQEWVAFATRQAELELGWSD
jgi:hypothetical protein